MTDVNPAARARNSVFLDGLAADPAAGRRIKQQRLLHRAYHFTDIDDNDDVLVGVRGVIACAWQANTVSDVAAVGVQTTSSLTSIRLQTGATNPDGWIHVLVGGTQAFTETNDETHVGRDTDGGVTGYVQGGSIFVNQKHATPNLLTNARVARTANLRLQFFPFTTALADGDRWKCASGTRGTDTLCSGIVSVAWQSATAADTTDACAVTLDAAGDVIFNCSGITPAGYLWVWRRA